MTHLNINTFDTKFKISTISTPSIQSSFNHTSYTDITGSQIDYIPSSDASFVIYEYKYYQCNSQQSRGSVLRFKLLESSDGLNWSDYGNKTDLVLGRGIGYNGGWVGQVRYCLDASSWTTQKYLKLQARHNSQKTGGDLDYNEDGYWTNSVRLHQLRLGYTPNSASGPYYYNTSVSCESVP